MPHTCETSNPAINGNAHNDAADNTGRVKRGDTFMSRKNLWLGSLMQPNEQSRVARMIGDHVLAWATQRGFGLQYTPFQLFCDHFDARSIAIGVVANELLYLNKTTVEDATPMFLNKMVFRSESLAASLLKRLKTEAEFGNSAIQTRTPPPSDRFDYFRDLGRAVSKKGCRNPEPDKDDPCPIARMLGIETPKT